MPVGPVEYVLIGFPGNRVSGEIVPALADLIDRGTIRLLDLVFIMKDADGNALAIEVDEQEELSVFAGLEGEVGGLIGEADLAHAAEALDPGTSAALLVWEDLWAIPLVEALRAAGGELIEGSRIPYDLIEPALAALKSAA